MAADHRPDRFRRRFFAWVYPKIAAREEQRGGAEHRRELLAGLSGRVVEVGAGHGVNFPYYPPSVAEVVAVEPETALRRRAEEAADRAAVPVRVVPGLADRLPLEDGGCDAVVFSLVLCSLPDVPAALAEARRVLRPGGEVRFYEHVRSDRPVPARIQRAADLLWPRIAGGCHLSRDTAGAMARAGLRIDSVRRFPFAGIPHVLGRATSPGYP